MSNPAEFYTPPMGWRPEGSIQWVACSNGNYPDNAVESGYDNGRLYVARAHFQGALIPGKLHADHKTCYVAWGGKEHSVPHYEVLVATPGSVRWSSSSRGQLVANAVVGGRTEDGEQLYIGRCLHGSAPQNTPGKIQPSHGVLYVAYGGKEVPFQNYQILHR